MVKKYIQNFIESDFVDLYRIDKDGLQFFANKLRSNGVLSRSTSAALSVECQLLLELWYFATGNSSTSLQNTASINLSHGAVHNCIVNNVSSAIASLGQEFIKFPNTSRGITERPR